MKKRFETLNGVYEGFIKDNEINGMYDENDRDTLVKLLNEQDKRIKSETAVKEFWYSAYKEKELTNDLLLKENQQLKQQLSNEEKSHDLCIDSFNEECEKLRKQIKFESDARERFKQSQNSKAIEELQKVKDYLLKEANNSDEISFVEYVIDDYIDNQITELRGENERYKI